MYVDMLALISHDDVHSYIADEATFSSTSGMSVGGKMRVITNAPYVKRRMEAKSEGKVREIKLHSEGNSTHQVNPDGYMKQIFAGITEQMIRDGRIDTCGAIGSVTAEDPSGTNIEDVPEYWDEISGEPLDPHEVKKARGEKIVEFKKHEVYMKVPIAEWWENTGKAPIGTRWIDVSKGDTVHKNTDPD